MSEAMKRGQTFVRVTDRANNEFFCPLDLLKDPKDVSDEEMENCVDDATVHRYSGDIDVNKVKG